MTSVIHLSVIFRQYNTGSKLITVRRKHHKDWKLGLFQFQKHDIESQATFHQFIYNKNNICHIMSYVRLYSILLFLADNDLTNSFETEVVSGNYG